VALWPDMSPWICRLACRAMTDMLNTPPAEGKVRREVEMFQLPNASHCVSIILSNGF
jgi:hypothetical protein